MNYSLINESFAFVMSLVISWTFGFWVFYELRPENNKKRIFTIAALTIAVIITGTIFPVYYLAKCYHQYILHHLDTKDVATIWIGNVPLDRNLGPIVSTLNKVEWFVPLGSGGWSKLVRNGGLPLKIKRKDGITYSFHVGYYLGDQTLVSYPLGGLALSKDLPQVLKDRGLPLP